MTHDHDLKIARSDNELGGSCARILGLAFAILPVLLWTLVNPLPTSGADLATPEPSSFSQTEAELVARMAREGTNVGRLYELGDLCHDAGVDGDKKAVTRAEDYLRQLLELEPTNAPAMALLGSVYTLKGRDAFWPTAQVRLVREGNGYMDRAVELAPEDLKTRLIRAFNNAHMPDFLGRAEIVRTDLDWLWQKVGKEPDRFTPKQRQEVALHWGRRLKRDNRAEEARRVWEAGRAIAPESKFGTELSTELSRLR